MFWKLYALIKIQIPYYCIQFFFRPGRVHAYHFVSSVERASSGSPVDDVEAFARAVFIRHPIRTDRSRFVVSRPSNRRRPER